MKNPWIGPMPSKPLPGTQAPLRVGTLVYLDAFTCGCIKGQVVYIDSQRQQAIVTITEKTNRYYSKGETVAVPFDKIMPRHALVVRQGQYRIRPYTWTFPCA